MPNSNTTNSPSGTDSTSGKKSGSKLGKWVFGILIFLGVCLIGFLIVAFGGQVRGSQICPDDFSERHFRYHQIPIIGTQVTGVKYNTFQSDLSRYLQSKSLLPSSPAPKTWHSVNDNCTDPNSIYFDAKLLEAYLDQYDSQYDLFWKTWSDKHPRLAKVFWPLVAALAREQLYTDIPGLFDSVADMPDNKQSLDTIRKSVSDLFMERAVEKQKLSEHATATRFISYAEILGAEETEIELLNIKSPEAENDATTVDDLEKRSLASGERLLKMAMSNAAPKKGDSETEEAESQTAPDVGEVDAGNAENVEADDSQSDANAGVSSLRSDEIDSIDLPAEAIPPDADSPVETLEKADSHAENENQQ